MLRTWKLNEWYTKKSTMKSKEREDLDIEKLINIQCTSKERAICSLMNIWRDTCTKAHMSVCKAVKNIQSKWKLVWYDKFFVKFSNIVFREMYWPILVLFHTHWGANKFKGFNQSFAFLRICLKWSSLLPFPFVLSRDNWVITAEFR
jgi:hypothetical protein